MASPICKSEQGKEILVNTVHIINCLPRTKQAEGWRTGLHGESSWLSRLPAHTTLARVLEGAKHAWNKARGLSDHQAPACCSRSRQQERTQPMSGNSSEGPLRSASGSPLLTYSVLLSFLTMLVPFQLFEGKTTLQEQGLYAPRQNSSDAFLCLLS